MRTKFNYGFTLIEVILAITILSTLTILTTQAISRALKARTKIQAEVDDVSSLRDSLRMIRADLNMAFHHRDFEQEINDLVTKSQKASAPTQPSQPTGFAPQPPTAPGATAAPARKTPRGDPATHFVGDNEKMGFVTMNNGRMTANAMQADFIEVGYAMKDCRNLSTSKSSHCLFRRVQSVLDNDVTIGGNEVVMLENISEFKLRYIGEGKQDWSNSWNSTKNSSDEVTKGKYPETVEVTLSVERESDGKKRAYSMLFVIPIHYPNNTDKSPSPPSPNGSAPANPSGNLGGAGGQ